MGVWVAPQLRTVTSKSYTKVGPKPLVDFVINERSVKMAIEVAFNQKAKGVQAYVQRFDCNYCEFKVN